MIDIDIKTFYGRYLRIFVISQNVVTGKPLQPSLMLAGKASELLKGASLRQALALPANITLGWRGLPGTNTLAYYENPKIMAVKSFMVQAPGYWPQSGWIGLADKL